jgi:hypothetical protein
MKCYRTADIDFREISSPLFGLTTHSLPVKFPMKATLPRVSNIRPKIREPYYIQASD